MTAKKAKTREIRIDLSNKYEMYENDKEYP